VQENAAGRGVKKMARNGDWIQTSQRHQMYPLDPHPSEIDILDIAHALSNLCRFNGHTRWFYSVAEHSCYVSDILPSELKLTGLLHDASEAYLCDMPRPIKRSPGFAEKYLEAEANLMKVIGIQFGFEWPLPEPVNDADNRLLCTEALQLMAPLHPDWKDRYNVVEGLTIAGWQPERARNEFLNRYLTLTTEI
jgi:hypothetical protein